MAIALAKLVDRRARRRCLGARCAVTRVAVQIGDPEDDQARVPVLTRRSAAARFVDCAVAVRDRERDADRVVGWILAAVRRGRQYTRRRLRSGEAACNVGTGRERSRRATPPATGWARRRAWRPEVRTGDAGSWMPSRAMTTTAARRRGPAWRRCSCEGASAPANRRRRCGVAGTWSSTASRTRSGSVVTPSSSHDRTMRSASRSALTEPPPVPVGRASASSAARSPRIA